MADKQLFTRKEAAFYLGTSERIFIHQLEPYLTSLKTSHGRKVFARTELDELKKHYRIPGRVADPDE